MPETRKPDLPLVDFLPKSELVLEDHTPQRAKFPVIDAHNHLGLWGGKTPAEIAEKVAAMDAVGIKATLSLDGNRGKPLAEDMRLLKQARPGRFYVLTILPWQDEFDKGGDFGARLAARLAEAREQGADGLKINKELGLRFRDKADKLVMPHDPRIGAVFAKCAELKIPCLYHIADPVAFFKPLSATNERYEEIAAHPTWHFYGPQFPSFMEVMESQEKLLEQNPNTVFQSAHIASYAENLAWVGGLLDRCPNLNVDIGDRLAELGRQPYTARKFLIKYADRIVYGTDQPIRPAVHRLYFRFFETWDEYFPYSPTEPPPQGRWMVYGVALPDDVIEKIYHKNAERIYGVKPR